MRGEGRRDRGGRRGDEMRGEEREERERGEERREQRGRGEKQTHASSSLGSSVPCHLPLSPPFSFQCPTESSLGGFPSSKPHSRPRQLCGFGCDFLWCFGCFFLFFWECFCDIEEEPCGVTVRQSLISSSLSLPLPFPLSYPLFPSSLSLFASSLLLSATFLLSLSFSSSLLFSLSSYSLPYSVHRVALSFPFPTPFSPISLAVSNCPLCLKTDPRLPLPLLLSLHRSLSL